MIRSIIIGLVDEQGREDLEERLKNYPIPSEEAVNLMLEYNRNHIKKVRDYCREKGIDCYKDIESGGIVFARMPEEKVEEYQNEGVVWIKYGDRDVLRGATTSC